MDFFKKEDRDFFIDTLRNGSHREIADIETTSVNKISIPVFSIEKANRIFAQRTTPTVVEGKAFRIWDVPNRPDSPDQIFKDILKYQQGSSDISWSDIIGRVRTFVSK